MSSSISKHQRYSTFNPVSVSGARTSDFNSVKYFSLLVEQGQHMGQLFWSFPPILQIFSTTHFLCDFSPLCKPEPQQKYVDWSWKKLQNLSSSVVDYLWWWSRIDELKENIFAKQWMKSVICWSELQLVTTLCWTVLARRITWRKRSWSWCKIWHMPHSPAVTTGQTLCWGVILTMIHNTQPELSWAGISQHLCCTPPDPCELIFEWKTQTKWTAFSQLIHEICFLNNMFLAIGLNSDCHQI